MVLRGAGLNELFPVSWFRTKKQKEIDDEELNKRFNDTVKFAFLW